MNNVLVLKKPDVTWLEHSHHYTFREVMYNDENVRRKLNISKSRL